MAVPLATLLVVTMAVNGPADVGFTPKVTVSELAVDAVTVPVAPLLNVTVLLPGVKENPSPAIVIVAASAAKSAVEDVTTGRTLAI